MPGKNQNPKDLRMKVRGFKGLSLSLGGKDRMLPGVGGRVLRGGIGQSGNLTNGDPESIMLWGEDG